MALLAGEVMDEAASVYLNDAAKLRWNYDVLLPYLKSALYELQAILESNGLPQVNEYSAVITVPPNTTELSAPSDMEVPLKLFERLPGETRWKSVSESFWEPDADKTDRLRWWTYREGKIQFLGAINSVEVRLQYVRSLSTIGGDTSAIEIPNAKGFLAARTAGLAAMFGGRATERADAANARANGFQTAFISTLTKRLQNKPVRRKPYLWLRR